MRKKFILGMSLMLFTISHAQVGINTTTPTTTLQIDGKDVATKVAGLIVPRFTGDQIFNMPISIAQGYTAASSANYSNLVYATSAASVANQTSTGRGEFLTTSGFFYWDDPGQKWRRLFVASSSASGNDGVVRIDGQSGSATIKPVLVDVGSNSGFASFPANGINVPTQIKQIQYTLPLAYAPSPTTSWPENIVSPQDSDIYINNVAAHGGKFRENPILGQVHLWRIIARLEVGASSSAAVSCLLRNPDSGFLTTSVQLIPGNSGGGPLITFTFTTIADNNSIDPNRGYQFWLDANTKLNSVTIVDITRVSLFKD